VRRVRWHPLALGDVSEAAAWYGVQGGVALETAFADELETALGRLASNPGIGSSRYADLLRIESLRHWPMHTFPHLIFYFDREPHLDVWRVLHSQRDVAGWMHGSKESQ